MSESNYILQLYFNFFIISGFSFLKRLQYISSIKSGKGSFHFSCLLFARLPNFLGFIPSSLAIWICKSERWYLFFALIHACVLLLKILSVSNKSVTGAKRKEYWTSGYTITLKNLANAKITLDVLRPVDIMLDSRQK